MYLNYCPVCGNYLVPVNGKEKCLTCGNPVSSEEKMPKLTPADVLMLKNNKAIAEECHKLLKGSDAEAYCAKRGLTPDIIERFTLGYVPAGYSKLSGQWGARLLFPIITPSGDVVGFGGRTLAVNPAEKGIPKYVNSAASTVYDKSSTLYGYNLASAKVDKFYLCEGFIDTISMYQHQYLYPVASLGTAFTQNQARLIKKKSDKITLCFDSDEAGQKAVMRALPLLLSVGYHHNNISVLMIKDGKDVDDILQRGGTFEEVSVMKYLEERKEYDALLDVLI